MHLWQSLVSWLFIPEGFRAAEGAVLLLGANTTRSLSWTRGASRNEVGYQLNMLSQFSSSQKVLWEYGAGAMLSRSRAAIFIAVPVTGATSLRKGMLKTGEDAEPQESLVWRM